MPQPLLPKAEDVANIARLLRAEGVGTFCIETTPEGGFTLTVGEGDKASRTSLPNTWAAKCGSAYLSKGLMLAMRET